MGKGACLLIPNWITCLPYSLQNHLINPPPLRCIVGAKSFQKLYIHKILELVFFMRFLWPVKLFNGQQITKVLLVRQYRYYTLKILGGMVDKLEYYQKSNFITDFDTNHEFSCHIFEL